MKERPILFSGPNVLAILADLKDRTRRVIRPAKCPDSGVMLSPAEVAGEINGGDFRFNRYGGPGDRLWVRESGWQPSTPTAKQLRDGADTWPEYWYAADGVTENDREDFKRWGWKHRPSIHMPRWASRIGLDLLEVRAEKLQDITESDAACEGVICFYHGGVTLSDPPRYKDYLGSETSFKYCAKSSFASLWGTIHDPAGRDGWTANPWVTVNVFRRVNGSN